jgi:hypothetical protein
MGLWCLRSDSVCDAKKAKIEFAATMETKLIDLLRTWSPDGLNTRDSDRNACVPIVMPHSNMSSRIVQKIKTAVSEHTPELEVIAAYTRSKSIKDILCPSELR